MLFRSKMLNSILSLIRTETLMFEDSIYAEADENQRKFIESGGYDKLKTTIPANFSLDKDVVLAARYDQGNCGSCYAVSAK